MAVANNAKQKAPGRPFAPGQSGNPSGRPAVAKAFRERCRQFMDRDPDGGFARLVALAEDSTHREHFAALQLIAAYAVGKPTQPLAGDDEGPSLRIVIDDGGEARG